MSNYLAVANVTAALQQLLLPPVQQAISGANVKFGRPSANPPQSPIVNIYLYQVTPNAAFRNADLPTRRSDGTLSQRPQAALDLHYLLTFQGNDDNLDPQVLLGAVVTALQNQPLLSRSQITQAQTQFGFLAGSGLDNQVESVRFTPSAFTLEEFSKLWSVFFQVEYSLSVAYQASVVLMESEVTPLSALPVNSRNLLVIPFQSPSVDQVVSQAGVTQPIVAGSTLLITGSQLQGPNTFLLIGGVEQAVTPSSNTQITFLLSSAVLASSAIFAGVQPLQVVQKTMLGTPATLHRGFASNVVPFVLRPTISLPIVAATDPNPPPALPLPAGKEGADAPLPAGTKLADVTVTVVPDTGVGQKAVLVLNNVTAGAPPQAFVSPVVIAKAKTNQIRFKIVVPTATSTYIARVQIDGAESVVTFDSTTHLPTGPTVTI